MTVSGYKTLGSHVLRKSNSSTQLELKFYVPLDTIKGHFGDVLSSQSLG